MIPSKLRREQHPHMCARIHPLMQVDLLLCLLLVRIIQPSSAQKYSSDAQILIAFVKNLSNPNSISTSKNPCFWEGVSCTSDNRVQSLNMANAQLVGTIPPAITSLSRLTYLNLSNNRLTGIIPAGFIYVPELAILDLSTNFLSGFIPPICSDSSSKLTQLYLNDNLLTGKLGISLANCQKLVALSLANNQLVDQNMLTTLSKLPTLQMISLSGNTIGAAIPSVINRWKSLKSLVLGACSLTGYLPDEIGSLKKIENFDIGSNGIIGSLPEALFSCVSLKKLYLNGNKFTGSIPSITGSLANLQTFYGNDNEFTGDMPESIFTLVQLRDLNVRNNRLQGTLSAEIANLKYMYSLDLSLNFFSEGIPREIIGCESLSWLDLSGNQLSGSIPSTIGNLTLLNYLNLSHNQLTGQIPSSLANLQSIQMLDVSYNQLAGLVPDTEVFHQFGTSAFENNKGLCGWITNQSAQACSKTPYKSFSSRIAIIVIIVAFVLVSIGAWQCIVRWSTLQPMTAGHKTSQVIFTVRDLYDATEGFSQRNLIEEGVHYKVYKGFLNGNEAVVVKCLRLEYVEQFHQVFTVYWMTLSRAKHPNLVHVLGWCSSMELLAVVTAFMPNGTLEQQLYEKDAAIINLPWKIRMQIAEGVANGLAYLHKSWQSDPLLRCELQSSSILLDEQFNAHILNVRIAKSKITSLEVQQISVLDGYTAPECTCGAMVTSSAEVYSYGMIVLELLTRKKPAEFFLWSGLSIAEALWQSFPAWDMVDPILKEENKPEQVLRLMEVALYCTDAIPDRRPSMETVLLMLKEVVYVDSIPTADLNPYQQQIQESDRHGMVIEGSTNDEYLVSMYQNPLYGNQILETGDVQ